MINKVIEEFNKLKDSEQAAHLSRFFKTGQGDYGEGDLFLGLKVPQTRDLVKKFYGSLSFKDLQILIENEYHEIRLFALLSLVAMFQRSKNVQEHEKIVTFYLKNIQYINNWDLVDLSASYILGEYYRNEDCKKLFELAKSKDLWKERIAIVSTHKFIKNKKYNATLKLCKYFLKTDKDLIQKACGWMLREVGKQDVEVLKQFLNKHSKSMPRTMLRYSIEKFTKDERKFYMEK